jgi:hypothetical protein
MTPVPPPDPEVMKNCRFNTGDALYFYFEWVPDGTGRRPLTLDDVKRMPLRMVKMLNVELLIRTFGEPALRQIHPGLFPPESETVLPAQP